MARGLNLGIGFGAERIGLAAIRWPRTASVLLVALIALIAVSLPNLRFDDDIHRVFLTDSPVSQAQIDYRAAQFPPTSTVVAFVESEGAFTPQDLARLRDLTLDLEFLDGIDAVASPFALRFPSSAGAPNGTPVFGAKIPEKYSAQVAAFRALGTGLPTFINAEATALLIGIRVDLDQSQMPVILPLIRGEFTAALPENLTVTFTGEDVISLEIVSGLKSDLIALNLWGGLLVCFAALVLLRDIRMVLLAALPAVCGALSVLGLSVWLGYPINVLSNVIPILVLVLGVADGVHLAGHFKASGDSARQTVVRIGPACALTALTTSLAFACIMLTSNDQLFEFAVLGALGTLLAFAILITSFALLALVVRPSKRAPPLFAMQIAERLAAIGLRWPKQSVALALALLVVSILGFQQTKAWFPLYQNLPQGSATVRVNDAIAEDFGGVFQMIIDVEGDWEDTRALVDRLENIAGPEAVLSEVGVARWLGVEGRPSNDDLSAFPIDLIAQVRPFENVSRLFISVPEPMRDAAAIALFDDLSAAAQDGGALRIFGLPTVMRHEAVSLISQLSRSLVLASIGATLVVALAFGSLRLFPLLLVPNILPLIVTGASLHIWASGQLSPTAVLALTIAFGIAIDDSVHFLNRFFEAQERGETSREAVRSATRSAGQVMVLTTVLLTFGLAVTLISGFFPIRLFGGMMIITLWAALIFDLLLLPALLGREESIDA